MKFNMKKVISILMVLACVFTMFPQIKADAASSDFKVIPIDTEGSATLIDLNGTYILIDGGENATKTVNYLKNHCSKKNGKIELEAVILTHNHGDHSNGIVKILESPGTFRVKNFYMENLFEPKEKDKKQKELTQAINTHKSVYKTYKYPSVTKLNPKDSVRGFGIIRNNINVLNVTIYPPVKNYINEDTREAKSDGYKLNESSLIVKVTSQTNKALMMGDCYDKGFVDLCRKYGVNEFQSDICVMAHHGLKTYNVADKGRYSIGNKNYSEIDLHNKYIGAYTYILPTTKDRINRHKNFAPNIARYKKGLRRVEGNRYSINIMFPYGDAYCESGWLK